MRYYDSLGDAGYPISGPPCTTMACSYDEHLARGSHGVDYAVKTGTPVISPAKGRTSNFSNSSAGNAVELHHVDASGNETGFVDTFMHLSQHVAPGLFEAGDIIGYSGNTGSSTGPHIHWVAKLNGNFVRQWEYFTEETRKDMPILVNNGSAEFVIGQEYIHHVSGPAEESALVAVLGPVIWKGGADFDNILKGFGVPADKVKLVMGGKTWSRVIETLQAVQAGGGGGATPQAIAKAVNDDVAKRMSS
jgi:murein DD-endopeptidase MepM/ murein hydrolase activator NlpD